MWSGTQPYRSPQEADEERPAVADFGQADGQHLPLGLLLVSDAPPQVNLGPGDTACFAVLAQFGKDALDQLFTLCVHITEGRGHKHPHDALWHQRPVHGAFKKRLATFHT